ncbi:hypothetical protein LguiA_002600 [Lonicera macranthoides]
MFPSPNAIPNPLLTSLLGPAIMLSLSAPSLSTRHNNSFPLPLLALETLSSRAALAVTLPPSLSLTTTL